MHRNAKRGKSGQSRNLALIMPEDYAVFSLLIKRTMKNARRKLEIPMPAAMLSRLHSTS